ncbi:hypothetical protein F4780DRAFT_778513 [Xylariomycetidae sp. FL0641]|nr:hypothetical protein F4780DRAFT_778513 [Xylariomycetidae sp. FL0641]
MASEKGPVATEAPSFPSTTPQSSVNTAPVSVETLAAEAARATQSLKRQREATPTSPSSVLPAPYNNPDLSPSKSARIAGLPTRHSPAPLTGAAAIEENKRKEEEQYKLQVSGASENPAYRAQTALLSASALAMSRPQDGPQPGDAAPPTGDAQIGDAPQPGDAPPEEQPPDPISIPNVEDSEPKSDVSPQSATSLASFGGSTDAPVASESAPEQATEQAPEQAPEPASEPAAMELDAQTDQPEFGTQPPAQMEEKGATSLSYPGILPSTSTMPAPPVRGMSMPMTPNAQGAPRSPSSKRHKCPYCETEFTRHHNLKSHLLTHSQEKPYVCQTCQMRFRRLHDLKRHSKLHTGEKPHVCPKCDRKFARGDALARHSKGPGGCVGRRSSLGSYMPEDDIEGTSRLEGGDDSVMSGVVYNNSNANEADMSEEDRQRLSGLPTIKAQQAQGKETALDIYIHTTYAQLFLLDVEQRGPASSNASQTGTSVSSVQMSSGNPAMYAQTAMTESPKPLSPSGLQGHDPTNANRQRSPSLATQFQQQQFGRHQPDRQTPPGLYSTYAFAPQHAKMSPVPGFTAADAARYAASAASASGTAPTSQSGSGSSNQPQALPGTGLGHNRSLSGPGQEGGSGDSSSNNIFATDQGIWAYIHSLEEQVRQLNDRVQGLEALERVREDKITHLTNEVTSLRSQVDTKAGTDEAEKTD